VVTTTVQRPPDQQRQQQAEDAGQHHDDAHNVRIQAVGERCGDSEPQDRPDRDQCDADGGADHPPSVHRHDETAIAHRCAVLRPTVAARVMTGWQNNGLATLIMESRGL
jgi:hypothetical protein